VICSNSHFVVVSLTFNVTDPNKEIFTNVHVYDNLKYVNKGRAAETIPFTTGDIAAKFLLTLQKFLSTFVFHNATNNNVLLNDEQYIMEKSKVCFLSMSAKLLWLFIICNWYITSSHFGFTCDETIFHQDGITAMRKQLQNVLSIDYKINKVDNPMSSLSKHFIISFYPQLYDYYSVIKSIEGDQYVKVMRSNNEVKTTTELHST
jgi:type I restriction-modification system DNA methylase subunit